VVSLILTIACLPLGPTVPRAGNDPSWQLGLSLVHVRGVPAGPGFVFTYGPVGFLATPNIVWLPGALFGLVYVAAVTFALYYLVLRALSEWLRPIASIIVTALFALATVQVFGRSGGVPELATMALIVWALLLIRPGLVRIELPVWAPLVFGAATALQFLVKFGTGGAALGVAIVVALARPPRLKNLALAGVSFFGSLLVLWLLAQQSPANFALWLGRSLQIAAGYSSAMAAIAGLGGTRYWLLWLVVVAVLLVAVWQYMRKYGALAFPSIAVVAIGAVFLTKEGFTRLDLGHAGITYLGLGVLIAAFPWKRRMLPVGLFGLAFALAAAVFAGSGYGPVSDWFTSVPSVLRSVATQPVHGLTEAGRILRSTVEPSYRSSELSASRRSIQAHYRVPDRVVAALRTSQVHADPLEIAAVWAYGLSWRPVPVFQTYQAYTPPLDQANADSLRSSKGPNAVIRNLNSDLLGRIPAWESPNYMVTLTCSFRLTAGTRQWQALVRTSDTCGRPRLISQQVARGGAPMVVPSAHDPDDVVVATFDYPSSATERLITSVLKPLHLPVVYANERRYYFVAGTASHMHLLHVPEAIGARHITNAGLDIRSLSFPNAPSAVTVRFYELSTH
jgi:hypothetical protein